MPEDIVSREAERLEIVGPIEVALVVVRLTVRAEFAVETRLVD